MSATNTESRVEDLKIEDMRFTNKWIGTRIRNVLMADGIVTLGDLVAKYSRDDLLQLPRFGAISIAELTVKLEGMGLKLKDPSW